MSLPSYRPTTQSGPYPGVGQGLPPKFPQRHPSTGLNPLQSPPFARSNPASFPFSAASSALPPVSSNSGNNGDSNNLDPSDFPALGSAAAAAAAGQTGSATATTATAGTTASALLSSYASQAGTTSSNSFSLTGSGQHLPTTGSLAGQPASSVQRAFSADDFPALGGFSASGDMSNSALTNGQTNGSVPSINGAGQRLSAKESQEQASAAAALQHQQQQSQHRASLLGSMNLGSAQSRTEADKRKHNSSSSTSQQPWAATPPGQFSLPPNGTGAASSPLPPNSANHSAESQSSLWSPAAASAQLPAAQALLGGNQQRPVGALSSGVSNSPLPPPASVPHGSQSIATGTGQMPQTPAQQVLFSPADRFGLLGLLQIIKSADSDLSMLALGNDLTTLGLDLGATDNLYSTFITPWSDSKAASALNIEPEFHLPSCYNVQPPPAQSKIGNFSDETLFFIFYSQPRDVMQEMAAHELYKHNWRYHKELRLWLTKEAGTEPTQKTASYERGSYIVFDPTLWERVRKEFVLEFSALESRRI